MDLERGAMPVPQDLEEILRSDSDIFVYSGIDTKGELRAKLEQEWEHLPLINDRLVEDEQGQADPTHRLLLVYITEFFTDGSDFAFYVKGQSNMSKFLLGTFSGQAYDQPCFATPVIVHEVNDIFDSGGFHTIADDRVMRTESKGLRWKYLYRSGMKAWEKLRIDEGKLEEIGRKFAEYEDRALLESDSDSQRTSVELDETDRAASSLEPSLPEPTTSESDVVPESDYEGAEDGDGDGEGDD